MDNIQISNLEKLDLLLKEIQLSLKPLRHTNNFVEITQCYIKLSELTDWITRAITVAPPNVSAENEAVKPTKKVNFAKEKQTPVAK